MIGWWGLEGHEKQTSAGIYKKMSTAGERMVQLKYYFYQFHFSVALRSHTRSHTETPIALIPFFSFLLSTSPCFNAPYTQLLPINLPLNISTPLKQLTCMHTLLNTLPLSLVLLTAQVPSMEKQCSMAAPLRPLLFEEGE